MLDMGPWLFRYQVVIIEEYDGFENPSLVALNKRVVWARVLKLPDNYFHDVVINGHVSAYWWDLGGTNNSSELEQRLMFLKTCAFRVYHQRY